MPYAGVNYIHAEHFHLKAVASSLHVATRTNKVARIILYYRGKKKEKGALTTTAGKQHLALD